MKQQLYEWATEPLTKDLIEQCKQNINCDTKVFFRPIFKWLKITSKHYDAEKCFAYVSWLLQLQVEGDAALSIATQSQLQPKNAYNIIINLSQRNNTANYALRAYDCMLKFGFEPDVFSYTALIVVLGRSGQFDKALDIYHIMLHHSREKPNVVTYTSLIRIARIVEDRVYGTEVVHRLLEDAQKLANTDATPSSTGQVDISIYNAAMSVFVRYGDAANLLIVVRLAVTLGPLHLQQLTCNILAKFCLFQNIDPNIFMSNLADEGIITIEEVDVLASYAINYIATRKAQTPLSRPAYVGCLSSEAPPTLRESVIAHDIHKLIERLVTNETSLVENDFITLMHQCRKRKWSNEIHTILASMKSLSDDGDEFLDIPPQPHLAPTLSAYRVALMSLFHMSCVEEAWSMYRTLPMCTLEVYETMLCGLIQCNQMSRACEVYGNMIRLRIFPDVSLYACLIRGLSCSCSILIILTDLASQKDSSNDELYTFADDDLRYFVCLFIESCACVGQPKHITPVLLALRRMKRYSTLLQKMRSGCDVRYLTALLMAAVCTHDASLGHGFLKLWQQFDFLPYHLIYHSLLRESLGSCSVESQLSMSTAMDSLPYKGLTFIGAAKYISSKGSMVSFILASEFTYDYYCHFNLYATVCADVTERHNVLCHYFSQTSVTATLCALQYIYSQLVYIRSKSEKQQLHRFVSDSLLSNSSNPNMLENILTVLPQLLLPPKQQLKLIRLLFECSESVQCCLFSNADAASMISLMQDVSLPLDIVKETIKHLPNAINSKREAVKLHCSYMVRNVENTMSIVQSLAQLQLIEELFFDCIEEGLLVVYLLKPADHWNALTTYTSHLPTNRIIHVISSLLAAGRESCAKKLIIKYQLADLIQFRSLMSASAVVVENVKVSSFPLVSLDVKKVRWVDTLGSLQDVSRVLLSQKVVGIDVEWRPSPTGYAVNKCSVLQLACHEVIAIFDLMEIEMEWNADHAILYDSFSEFITRLFSSNGIVKLGYKMKNDMNRLHESFPLSRHFRSIHNYIELSSYHTSGGLATLCEEVLHCGLDKRMQRSDWQRRPLLEEQVMYAALDAYVLVLMYDKLAGSNTLCMEKFSYVCIL